MSSSQNSSSSTEPGAPAHFAQLAWLGDIQCPVDFVVGSSTIKVRDCVRLERHQVFRLAQAAGGDLEVRISGVPIATGEVVVRDDSTSLRIGRMLGPAGPSLL